MGRLTARLARLEAAAEEARLRRQAEWLAAENGLPVGDVLAVVRPLQPRIRAIQRQHPPRLVGGAWDHTPTVRALAAEFGMDPDELLHRTRELAARLEGDA